MAASAADERVAQATQLLREGQFMLAELLLRQALAEQPEHVGALAYLAQLHHRAGRHEEALACFDSALRAAPQAPALLHARGLALKTLGRFEQALSAYDAALSAAPDYFEAHHNRGVVLRLLGRPGEAVASCRRAVALQPASADAHNGLGMVLQAAGEPAAALEAFELALQLRPGDPDVMNNRGIALQQLGRLQEAAVALEQSLGRGPHAPRTLMNLGVVRHDQQRYGDALAAFDAALQLAADDADVLLNRANTLFELGRFQDALAELRALRESRPGDSGIAMNLANMLRDMQRQEEALSTYQGALSRDPEDADLHWNYSLCLLALGDFERGWPEYEWRWRARQLGKVERQLDVPKWLGSPALAGKTILLHAEQGLGDTLQMVRYAALVAAQGAQVVLQVQRPLLPLMDGLAGVSRLCDMEAEVPPVDFHCPLFSLPLALGTRLNTVPAPPAYLAPDAARVARWRPVVRDGDRAQVGLAWSGNPDFPGNTKRSVSLGALLDALPRGPRYWCLLKDVPPADLPLVQAGRIHCFEENGFADTAAQISLLDGVVAVDTSLAHLACALGQRTWILLSHAADFRWLRAREDSPWYPGARLLRQARPGDWSLPLQQLASDLAALSASS
jgi:Tfp pilus assembly protein PilF